MRATLSTNNSNISFANNLINSFKEKEKLSYDMLTHKKGICMKVWTLKCIMSLKYEFFYINLIIVNVQVLNILLILIEVGERKASIKIQFLFLLPTYRNKLKYLNIRRCYLLLHGSLLKIEEWQTCSRNLLRLMSYL